MIRLGRWARDILEASIVAVLLGLLVRTFIVQAYRVPSASMEPGLRPGDYVLVNKLLLGDRRREWPNPWLPQRPTARGDILVFPHPSESHRLLIKRCLAGSGAHVQIRDKVLFIDREIVQEDYVVLNDDRVYPASSFLPRQFRVRDQFGPAVVSEGGLFCLGDNRDQSLDSRHWGSVETQRVVGRAVIGFRMRRATPSATAEPDGAEGAARKPRDGSSTWRVFRIH